MKFHNRVYLNLHTAIENLFLKMPNFTFQNSTLHSENLWSAVFEIGYVTYGYIITNMMIRTEQFENIFLDNFYL